MSREVHVRFWESAGVGFPRATHLDLSPPEKPPPEFRDVVRVPVDDEGRESELHPA